MIELFLLLVMGLGQPLPIRRFLSGSGTSSDAAHRSPLYTVCLSLGGMPVSGGYADCMEHMWHVLVMDPGPTQDSP